MKNFEIKILEICIGMIRKNNYTSDSLKKSIVSFNRLRSKINENYRTYIIRMFLSFFQAATESHRRKRNMPKKKNYHIGGKNWNEQMKRDLFMFLLLLKISCFLKMTNVGNLFTVDKGKIFGNNDVTEHRRIIL